MKKTAAICLFVILILSMAGCSRQALSLSFADLDVSGVSQVKLENCHNGQASLLTDREAVADICSYLRRISGTSSKEQSGFYEGSYAVTLLDETGTAVFDIVFGDSDVFYQALDGSGGITRFDLTGSTAEEIRVFFSQYDTSGFQWHS